MTRSELIERVAERLDGYTLKQAEIIVETFFDALKESLRNGERVELRGFGVFGLKIRMPRRARNPKTGQPVDIDTKRVVFFRTGKELKDLLNHCPGE
jgi:integration host factor subunit beta